MDILTNVVQIAASNPVLIFVVGSLSVLSLYLTFTIARQRKQIAVLKAPPRRRYGFLGKPLYSFILLALFVGGFGLTYFGSQNVQNVTVNADTNVGLELKAEIQSATVEGNEVKFSVVPSVNGVEWGGAKGPVFDAFWTAAGPSSFSEIELDLSSVHPSGFTKILRPGTYQVTVDIVVGGRRFNKTVTVSL